MQPRLAGAGTQGDRKASQRFKELDVSTTTSKHSKLTIKDDPVQLWRKTPVRKTEAAAWWTLQVQVFVDSFIARPSTATKERVQRILAEYAAAVQRGEVEPPTARTSH
jgi:hypothetical protein